MLLRLVETYSRFNQKFYIYNLSNVLQTLQESLCVIFFSVCFNIFKTHSVRLSSVIPNGVIKYPAKITPRPVKASKSAYCHAVPIFALPESILTTNFHVVVFSVFALPCCVVQVKSLIHITALEAFH